MHKCHVQLQSLYMRCWSTNTKCIACNIYFATDSLISWIHRSRMFDRFIYSHNINDAIQQAIKHKQVHYVNKSSYKIYFDQINVSKKNFFFLIDSQIENRNHIPIDIDFSCFVRVCIGLFFLFFSFCFRLNSSIRLHQFLLAFVGIFIHLLHMNMICITHKIRA